MNPRTTGILALVALLLGGFVYFYEIEGEPARQAELDEENRFFPGLVDADLDAIELTTEDGTPARFERRDGRWRIVSPVSGLADSSALDAMAHALASLSRAGSVANPEGLDQYGLGENERVVYFEVARSTGTGSGDGIRKGLKIGGPTPVGGQTYVTRWDEAKSEIVYVETYRINAFNKKLDDLRERRIFPFDVGDVRTLRVVWQRDGAETEVALARDEEAEWQMGVPVDTRGDQQTIRALLSDLSFLRAKAFIDEIDDLGEVGERSEAIEAALSEPHVTIHWTLDGDHLERRARIGGPFESGLLVEGPERRLYIVDAERKDDFKTSITAYRDKMLSEFDIASARRLTLKFSDEGEDVLHVAARLGDVGWTSEGPRIDPDRASDLVRALASLRAEDITADSMGPAELESLGLAPPRVEIRIEDAAKAGEKVNPLAGVALGNRVEGRGIFAQRIGEPTVYVLPGDIAAEIPISRAAFFREFEVDEGDDVTTEALSEESELEPLEADSLEGLEIP